MPPLFAALFFYAAYRAVRGVVLWAKRPSRFDRESGSPAPGPAQSPVRAVADLAKAQPTGQRSAHRRARHSRYEDFKLPRKGIRQKIMELTGSMLLASIMATVLGVVAWMFIVVEMDSSQFVWLACAGAVGSWAVMVPSKIWEGGEGDEASRRVAMLVSGLLAGAAVFGLSDWLLVELSQDAEWAPSISGRLTDRFHANGDLLLSGYVAYFGLLFLTLRWWKLADPLRRYRLSVWSTGTCLFAAWLLGSFLAFPLSWGVALAAVISMSIQLSSPWVPPGERKALAEEIEI